MPALREALSLLPLTFHGFAAVRRGGVLAVVVLVAFSSMFAISVVGPLLDELAVADSIPLGPAPNTSLGLIFALGGLSLAAFQVPIASLSDRHDRRAIVAAGGAGVAVTVALIGYSKPVASALRLSGILPGGWGWSTLLLSLFRVLEGAAAAATWPVLMAVVASSFPPEQMGYAMGVFGASFGLGMSLGPVLGPALASAAGVRAPFLAAAMLAALGALVSAALPGGRGARRERKAFARDWRLVSLSLVAFTLLYGMGSLVVIYPRFMRELGLGLGDVAIAMALAGLTYTLLQPPTGKLADKADRRLMVVMGLLIAALSVSAAGAACCRAAVFASMLAFGLSASFAFPAANALLGVIAPPELKGAYSGFYNAMLSLGVTVSPIVVGVVADSAGYFTAFLTPLLLVIPVEILFVSVFYR